VKFHKNFSELIRAAFPNLDDLPLCEIFYFTDTATVESTFLAKPQKRIRTALGKPKAYLEVRNFVIGDNI
jgi:hypothetical protein